MQGQKPRPWYRKQSPSDRLMNPTDNPLYLIKPGIVRNEPMQRKGGWLDWSQVFLIHSVNISILTAPIWSHLHRFVQKTPLDQCPINFSRVVLGDKYCHHMRRLHSIAGPKSRRRPGNRWSSLVNSSGQARLHPASQLSNRRFPRGAMIGMEFAADGMKPRLNTRSTRSNDV